MKFSSRIRMGVTLAALAAVTLVASLAFAADTTAPAAAAKPAKASTDKAIAAIDAQIAAFKINKTAATWKTTLPKPKAVAFDANKKYLLRMETSEGTLVITLKPKVAPMHVTSFMYLARLGFFDGLKFHRVMQGFMAQGGDPLGNGGGGPGYQMDPEVSPTVKHDAIGVVSTANAGPGTDGSQFFIMFTPYPSLDGNYTIWGQVTEGLDVVKKLESFGQPRGRDGAPTKPLSIKKCTVEAV